MSMYKVRLLSASYDRESHTIELYGRTLDNKSITILHDGFKPYLILVNPSQQVIDQIKTDPEYHSSTELELLVGLTLKPCLKVYVKHSWEVPRLREFYGKYIPILSADIPFHHRFIYDWDIHACIRVEGTKFTTDRYTTDIVLKGEKYAPIESFTPDLHIVSFDIECSMEDGSLLCLAVHAKQGSKEATSTFIGSEESIIAHFVEYIQEEDPDVITGWNIDGYDFPQLNKILLRLGMDTLPFGRNHSKMRSHGERFWRATGRIVVDAWWSTKTLMAPKQESLSFCAREYLKDDKLNIPNKDINKMWRGNPEYVVKYCAKDAQLALRILEHIAILPKSMDLATVSKLPLDDIVNGSTSTLIDSIMIRAADRAGIAVPCSKHVHKDRKIEGAYVHKTVPGVYPWVIALDFKSMYPSMIISNNICFTTLDPRGTIVNTHTGAHFLTPDIRKGLVPQILEGLLLDRAKFNKLKKEAKDERTIEYYDGLQYAVKILMNSFYGVFASSFYRFTNPLIGESITTFAKENITKVIGSLTSTGIKVLYSDTDSVFIESPHHNLDDCVKFGNEVSTKYSRPGVTFEFDKVFESFFTHGKKKRYAGKIVWPEKKLLIRGYETRRGDSFLYQSVTLEKCLSLVLDNNPKGAVELARGTVSLIRTGNKVELARLVISKTCKEFGYYLNPRAMPAVQAAQKLINMGQDFIAGMKVSWIVTNARTKPMTVEPYVEGLPFTGKPDYRYYAERCALTLARVTDMFGWDESSLLSNRLQMKLDIGTTTAEVEEDNDNDEIGD